MKWSKSPERALNGHQVQMMINVAEDEEILQSAEIVYRELQSHGLKVLMDDRAAVPPQMKSEDAVKMGAKVRMSLTREAFAEGEIELVGPNGRAARVRIEDAVEKTVEIVRGNPA